MSSVATAPGSTSDTRTWRPVDLLAQRLAERADGVLRRLVDAAAGGHAAPGDGRDVHEVGDVARALLRRLEQVRQRRVRDAHERRAR